MKNLKKVLNLLKGFLPVSQKMYLKDIKSITTVLGALTHSEAQHAQIELRLVQDVAALNAGKYPAKKDSKKQMSNLSYQ